MFAFVVCFIAVQALWLVSEQLVHRLDRHFEEEEGKEQEPFTISYQEPLPLADFFGCIDDHFSVSTAAAPAVIPFFHVSLVVGCFFLAEVQCRQVLGEVNDKLNDRAHQLRQIQKRLLVRFKDRNPAPLANLDVLMEGTHSQIMEIANEVCCCGPYAVL